MEIIVGLSRSRRSRRSRELFNWNFWFISLNELIDNPVPVPHQILMKIPHNGVVHDVTHIRRHCHSLSLSPSQWSTQWSATQLGNCNWVDVTAVTVTEGCRPTVDLDRCVAPLCPVLVLFKKGSQLRAVDKGSSGRTLYTKYRGYPHYLHRSIIYSISSQLI